MAESWYKEWGTLYTFGKVSTSATAVKYEGKLDNADCSTVSGWVWNKSYPQTALTVELVEGSTVLATTVANGYRNDLKNGGVGTGNYAFRMNLPSSVKDGKLHQLSVRVKDGNYTLGNSPRMVSCTTGGRLPAFKEYANNNDKNSEWELILAPNPTSSIVSLTFNLENNVFAYISVINVKGQVICQKVVVGAESKIMQEIDLKDQIEGVYILKVQIGNKIESRKIVLKK